MENIRDKGLLLHNTFVSMQLNSEPLFKHKSLKVYGMELAMDVDIHYKAIDAWSTILNTNEEVKSSNKPSRAFLYVYQMVSKNG